MKARFIEPMLLLPTDRLPDDQDRYEYGLKLDGFRAVAFKTGGRIELRSRNDKDFAGRYPGVIKGLAGLPDDTVIDGEIVALDEQGKPSFTRLASIESSRAPVFYYVFDVMMLGGRDIMREPLSVRRERLRQEVLPKLAEPVRYAAPLEADLPTLITSVKAHGFEGLVGKRLDSPYEPGLRSGRWQKMRVNQGQEFVIGGYTIGSSTFDAIVIGYYEGDRLIYIARTRNGFTPASRAQLFRKFRGLEIDTCPFVNLPEAGGGRWGPGLTKEKMAQCRWLRPQLVAQIEFVEWTEGNHLRHTRFIGLREDKRARDVTAERPAPRHSE
jgi:DNA ligase D-like protein (predicted ligase)